MVDFRTLCNKAKEEIQKINERDSNWSWKISILKDEVQIWWGYLQYCDTQESHFTIRMGTKEEGNLCDDFMKAIDEHGETISGSLVGDEFYCDGTHEDCIVRLMRAIERKAHRYEKKNL